VGIATRAYYAGFQPRANRIKNDLVRFLIEAQQTGKTVMAYGAAAKGNTLLNYAGVRADLLRARWTESGKAGEVHARQPHTIVAQRHLEDARPEFVLILPWNLKEEVMSQLEFIAQWGGKFVTAVPALEVVG